MKHLKNHAVIADAKAVLARTGERFSKLERVGLRCVKAHFGTDASSVQGGESFKLIFRGRREDVFHVYRL